MRTYPESKIKTKNSSLCSKVVDEFHKSCSCGYHLVKKMGEPNTVNSVSCVNLVKSVM